MSPREKMAAENNRKMHQVLSQELKAGEKELSAVLALILTYLVSEARL